MQAYFYELADALCAQAASDEVLLLRFGGETSDFIRFNRSRVRQAGSVTQGYLTMELINGQRHAAASVTVSMAKETDLARLCETLGILRDQLPHLPEDPYLLYATEVRSGEQHGENNLPQRDVPLAAILKAGAGRDMVGIYAQGPIFAGFANSLGQKNWFATHSFSLDWSFYHAADKAVKSTYAGFTWSDATFEGKVAAATEQLAMLSRPATTISPGSYRVYLTPTALAEFVDVLCWEGFSLKAHRTKTTPFLKMTEEGATLSPALTITENTADGIAPNFQSQGFIRPDQVALIAGGRYRECLVSPRSGKEYGVNPNGATAGEQPSSLDMAAGDVPSEDVLKRLDTGVYISQTWYLNFSDQPSCRITGMTRFATFWVEQGSIVAPLNVMRFDETGFRAFGDNLLGLTAERDFLPDPSTYGGRSTTSARLPGALIEGFTFTL
jgi:predicted Zn-dependent protease